MLAHVAGAALYNQWQKAPKNNILERIYSMSPQSYAFDRQSEFAEKMAIDAFNREAAYNSPAAQMARFKEAGLNPNLIYGQGNSGNVSASTPTASHAAPGMPGFIPLMMQVAGFMKEMEMKDAQINSLNIGAGQKEVATLMTSEKLDQLKQSFPMIFENLVTSTGIKSTQLASDKIKLGMLPLQEEKLSREITNLLARTGSEISRQNLNTIQIQKLKQETINKELEEKLLKAQTMFVEQGITNPQQFFQFLGNMLMKAMIK